MSIKPYGYRSPYELVKSWVDCLPIGANAKNELCDQMEFEIHKHSTSGLVIPFSPKSLAREAKYFQDDQLKQLFKFAELAISKIRKDAYDHKIIFEQQAINHIHNNGLLCIDYLMKKYFYKPLEKVENANSKMGLITLAQAARNLLHIPKESWYNIAFHLAAQLPGNTKEILNKYYIKYTN